MWYTSSSSFRRGSVKRLMLLAVLAVMVGAVPVQAGEGGNPFLPKPEINVGIMLPGYFQLDLAGLEFDGNESSADWGVNLIAWEITFLRWGRFEFAGLGCGWGVRGSGTKVTISGDVRHPAEHVFYASTPIRFRLTGPRGPDKISWNLSVHPLVTYIRDAGGDRTVYGVAAGVSVSFRTWPD
jgi:hypothetical protein